MDFDTIDGLRDRHAAWRLLRSTNAPLTLSFLGAFFIDANQGASPAGVVIDALDDHLHRIGSGPSETGEPRFPKEPKSYLEDWASPESGWLRRFYPAGDDEVHYEITPAFEKAHTWVESLQGRSFVGTESRLHTVVELLRQIVHGTQTDPEARLIELRRRRAEIDAEIASAEAGDIAVMDRAGVRDRYQQLSGTARELLSDFREVEENFRLLDRAAREKIAAWDGSKGALLAELVGSRTDITASDQGRSFQAFYDFILSESRQDELTTLLAEVTGMEIVDDDRLRTIHHDWSEAAERAQRTVRQISEQLRRFLDDQVWLENRRVVDLVRAVEAAALQVRDQPPAIGLDVDAAGITIDLPLDRPLHEPPTDARVESLIPPEVDTELDADLLFSQTFVDPARLANTIRAVLPAGTSALLEDVVTLYPIEQGAAEVVSYLALDDDDLVVELDDTAETVIDWTTGEGDDSRTVRARLPRVTVSRR